MKVRWLSLVWPDVRLSSLKAGVFSQRGVEEGWAEGVAMGEVEERGYRQGRGSPLRGLSTGLA